MAREHYLTLIEEHGSSYRGVGWNSEQAQIIRFRHLCTMMDDPGASILDFGCGYGALADYLRTQGFHGNYTGYDLLPLSVEHARKIHRKWKSCVFTTTTTELLPSDYTFASGIFNVRREVDTGRWSVYVRETLRKMATLCIRGFAFNMLPPVSSPALLKAELYYEDPEHMAALCKREFAGDVSVVQNYGLHDFTVHVLLS